jgi:hypothetical protein
MDTIHKVFVNRIITTELWPPISHDFRNYDFYLWGNLNGKVYKNNPHTTEALQNEITYVIASVTEDKFQNMYQNLFRQCEACLTPEGCVCVWALPAILMKYGKLHCLFYSIKL